MATDINLHEEQHRGTFINAIKENKKLSITTRSGINDFVTHICAPLDFGKKSEDAPNYFVFYDYNEGIKKAMLAVSLIELEIINETFNTNDLPYDPAAYNLLRDW